MNRRFFLGIFLFCVLGLLGCENPQPGQAAYSGIQGITLDDLEADEKPVPVESLLSFSVLTYVLDIDSLDSFVPLIESLSQRDVLYENEEAFEANGFSVGCGSHEQGADIAQELQSIGAVRVSRGTLMIPPNSNEILSGTDVDGTRPVVYSTSAVGAGGATLGRGKVGWIISAKPDPDEKETVQVSLAPAFWKMVGRELRMLAGQEPFRFQFFEVGYIRLPLKTRQFCIVGPNRFVPDQNTLDSILFNVPRREKVRLFVIIYGGQRGVDGD